MLLTLSLKASTPQASCELLIRQFCNYVSLTALSGNQEPSISVTTDFVNVIHIELECQAWTQL